MTEHADPGADLDDGLILGASDRIELIATIIMAAAAILTAWAAFQSAKWSGIQAIEFSKANASRVESTRFDTRAGQLTAVDVSVFLAWVEAVNAEIQSGQLSSASEYQPDPSTLSGFYYSRMRDEFKPALEAWLATKPLETVGAPPTPFAMEQYQLADAAEADRLLTEAGDHTDAALTANQNSDNHVLTAVALALVIFFGGVSSKLEVRRNRILTIALGVVLFLGAGVTLLLLPKVSPF
ncbi:MAG: hypothetical protein WB245_06795 [Acidimicrobiia bacterium]